MNRWGFCIVFLLVLVTCCSYASRVIETENEIKFIKLKFLSQEEARELLGSEDRYINQLTKFDMSALCGDVYSSKENVRDKIKANALEWTEDEKRRWNEVADSLNSIILRNGYLLKLPENIRLVKSTLEECGGAGGYTREDYIVLGETSNFTSKYMMMELLIHELFHVISRNSPDFREKMYGVVGFTVLPDEIVIPEKLRDRMITNPDVNKYDCWADFMIEGKRTKCTMILFAREEYDGGSFLYYVNIGLLQLDDNYAPVCDENGDVILYHVEQATDFFHKVGDNTNYILHPEEIMATNFTYLLTETWHELPSQHIIMKIKEILLHK